MTQNEVPQFSVMATEMKREAARIAANEAQKFFKNSFVKGGFTDSAFHHWTGRISPLGGKKILYNQATLMHSIQPTEQTEQRIVITSDTPYSEIHNSGGTITVTPQMKKFFWAKYYELAGNVKKTKSGKTSQSAANRKLSAKAEYCKNMALMKVGSKIKIPKRQFMGDSPTLMRQLEQYMKKYIQQRKIQ